MNRITAGLLAIAAATSAGAAEAQSIPTTPFSLEVRGGLAVPTGDFEDAVENGYSLGANGTYMFTPQLGVYAGVTFNSFGITDEVEAFGIEGSVRDYGLDAGVKAVFATPTLPVSPFIRGGLVYHKADLRIEGDFLDEFGIEDDDLESDYGLGFELGGGIMIPLGPRLSFTPAVIYTSYEPGTDDETEGAEDLGNGDNLTHFRVDVGLNIRF
ncbi:MAG TPA: outer membrane beta-barrel protein [Longimicrobium sp.]|jgi:opacity protein-like surface antigen